MTAVLDLDRWPSLRDLEADEEREQMRVAALVNEWRHLRAQGVPAGSQCQRMARLRAELLAAGEWVVVNE